MTLLKLSFLHVSSAMHWSFLRKNIQHFENPLSTSFQKILWRKSFKQIFRGDPLRKSIQETLWEDHLSKSFESMFEVTPAGNISSSPLREAFGANPLRKSFGQIPWSAMFEYKSLSANPLRQSLEKILCRNHLKKSFEEIHCANPLRESLEQIL